MKQAESQKLLSQYLSGSEKVTLHDIKKAEYKELFSFYLKKFSFNKPWLNFAVFPLVIVALFFSDTNS